VDGKKRTLDGDADVNRNEKLQRSRAKESEVEERRPANAAQGKVTQSAMHESSAAAAAG
jgi:hypothetical protein